MRGLIAGGAAVMAVAAGALWWGLGTASEGAALVMPASADPARGAQLYASHCAACHGAQLEGQPDWRSPGPDGRLPAPPHDATGHTWHHSDALLFEYTALGGQEVMSRKGIAFDSGMPGFADVLSQDQIWDILAFIKSTWPEREREVQAAQTAAGG